MAINNLRSRAERSGNSSGLNLKPMSSETWELVEYRLWNKMAGRIWALLGAFLTIVSVLGLLGIPAYIRDQFRDNIEKEKQKFTAIRSVMTREWQVMYAQNKIITRELPASIKAHELVGRYSYEVLLSVTRGQSYEFGSSAISGQKVVKWIELMQSESMNPEQYRQMIADAPALNSPIDRNSISSTNLKVISRLRDLVEIYPHAMAISKTLDESLAILISLERESDVRKALLVRSYQNDFYPAYKRNLQAYKPSYSMRAGRDWSTPLPNAEFEFPGLGPILPSDAQ